MNVRAGDQWHCLVCGSQMIEVDGRWECPDCGAAFTAAQLAPWADDYDKERL